MDTIAPSMDDVRRMYKLFETFESVIDDDLFSEMVDRFGRDFLVADCMQLQTAIDRIMAKKGKPIRPTCKTKAAGNRMSNKETVQDLFTWEETLRTTGGNTFAADAAVSAEQAKRYVTGALQHLLAVLLIAKEEPKILDAAIAVVERALE